MGRSRTRTHLLVLLLTSLGFAIRLVELEGRSLWLDEGFSLLHLEQEWSELFSGVVYRQGIPTRSMHPPLYFALLKLVNELGGAHLFVWRLLSVFCSTLLVPLTWSAAHRFTGRAIAGVFAALLASIAPAYLWQAAEVRMYALVAAWGAASFYLALRLTNKGYSPMWVLPAWVLVSAAGLLTHYSYTFIVAAQLPFVGWGVLQHLRQGRLSGRLILGAVLISVATLGAFLTIPQASREQLLHFLTTATAKGLPAVDPRPLATEIGNAFAFGLNAGDPTGGWITTAFGLVALIGLLFGLQRGVVQPALAFATVAMPVIAWSWLGQRIENQPTFRYVVYVFPVLHVGLGSALNELEKTLPKVPLIVLLGASALLAPNLFGAWMTHVRTPTWHDDWQGMAEHLRQNLRKGDGILLSLQASESALAYYLGWPTQRLETAGSWRNYSAREVTTIMARRYARLWVVLAGGDEDYWNSFTLAIAQPFTFLEEITFPARTTVPRLRLYEIQPLLTHALPENAYTLSSEDRGLAAVSFSTADLIFDRPAFNLIAYWRKTPELPQSLSLKLEHQGETWYDFRASVALGNPISQLEDNVFYVTCHTFPAWPGLPPLPYVLKITTLDASERVIQHATLALQPDDVIRYLRVPKLGASPVWSGEAISLMRAEFPPNLAEGNALPVVLTWRVEKTPHSNDVVRIELEGRESVFAEHALGEHPWPAEQWPVGEIVRDQFALPTEAMPAGHYKLLLTLTSGGKRHRLTLGDVRIEPLPPIPVQLDFNRPVDARVGAVSLLGYRVEPLSARDTLTVVTFWRVEEKSSEDGRLFVHLFDPEGNFVAQDDGAPFNGARTMRALRPGDLVRQVHVMRASAPLRSGTYTLRAGVYNATTLERWPVTQNGAPARDNLVDLGRVEIP